MFDFLDSDWFNIGIEIVFVLMLSYDIKEYIHTKNKKYITNIVLTIGFAIWALYPYYNSYVGWDEVQKKQMISTCKETNNTKLCRCMDDTIFKTYTYDEYKSTDKNSTEYKEFLDETKEECLDDSWF
jgi:hypothetical protein